MEKNNAYFNHLSRMCLVKGINQCRQWTSNTTESSFIKTQNHSLLTSSTAFPPLNGDDSQLNCCWFLFFLVSNSLINAPTLPASKIHLSELHWPKVLSWQWFFSRISASHRPEDELFEWDVLLLCNCHISQLYARFKLPCVLRQPLI